MAAAIKHKRGDTFIRDCTVSMAGAAPADGIADWDIRCQVRIGSRLVSELVVTVLDAAAGTFRIAAMTTASWPVGRLSADIQYTLPTGEISSTETFSIDCIEDVTR